MNSELFRFTDQAKHAFVEKINFHNLCEIALNDSDATTTCGLARAQRECCEFRM